MGRKNNKYKGKHQEPSYASTSKIEINEEELLAQCLQLHQLLKNRTAKIRALQTGDFCFILSTKWLRDWKDYVSYQKIAEGQKQENYSKKDKKYGRRHPGKINTDIMASTNEVNQFYTIPPEMKEYDYLRQIINEKKEKDDDYIAVTQDIWFGFLQYYEGEEIRRPVKKLKSSTYYEGDPLRVDTIFVNLQSEQLQQKIKKTSKKLYNSVFPSQKLLLPCLWTYKELNQFLSEYCKYVYNSQKIRIWKGFAYIATNPLVEQLVETIKQKKYLIKGREITAEKYQDIDLDDYIKNTHTLVVQIGQVFKTDSQIEDNIKGYCEECVTKKDLVIGCLCHEVWYCSRKCRINDQAFHTKSCKLAFDSQDDQQYEKKSLSQCPTAGLDNLGNTCYMNSTLQAIFSLDHIRQFLSKNQYLQSLNEKELKDNNCIFLRKLSKTIKGLIQDQSSYSPWSLKSQIDYNLVPFKGDKQHDANDFLINFINLINDHLSKSGDRAYNKMLEPFVGEFHSLVICPLCNIKSQNIEIFTQISLPIKTKAKQQTYSYCIIDELNHLTRGKANLSQTWKQMKSNLNLSQDTLVFISKQPEGLILVDQEEKDPEKTIKGLKGELIFLKNLKSKEDQYLFVTNLVTMKVICGSKMKSPYGVPYIVSVNDIQKTIGTFWLQIIKTYFWHNEEIIAEATKIEKQYLCQIEQAVKKEILQKPIIKSEEQTQATAVEEKQSQACKKIVESYNTRLKLFTEKIGIEIYINDFRKVKGFCHFCKKKCQNCDLPKIFDKPFEDFFAMKYKEVRFQVYLRDALEIDTKLADLTNNGDPNLHDCLNLFNQPEQLDQQNAWYCANCDNMALALKQMSVKTFPDILIIHLNRFKTVDGKKMKNSDPIAYNEIQNFGGKEYRLVGVVVHQGSMQGGHYWSICLRGNQYYVFNDSKVNKVEKVFNRNAYILIYRSLNFSV